MMHAYTFDRDEDAARWDRMRADIHNTYGDDNDDTEEA